MKLISALIILFGDNPDAQIKAKLQAEIKRIKTEDEFREMFHETADMDPVTCRETMRAFRMLRGK